MKKMRNKAIRYTSIAMSAVMLAGTVVSTVSADEAKEEVELTVFGNQYQPSEVGTQYDIIADKIAEETGVRINCVEIDNGTNEADIISTWMASNDLPDVFYVPNDEILQKLIDAGMIMELSDYWNEENCPNLCGATPDLARRQEYMSEKKFGGDHYEVFLWGGTGAENQPTVGFYVPWNIYKEAGYPEVNTLDDLVNAIELMQKNCPETESGLPTYGASGWFAEAGSWGSWCVDQIAMCMGYICDTPVYTFDVENRTILDTPPLTDPDSIWWQAMKFYFDLNQRGLLDPDCITLKYDQWLEKTSASQYMMIMPGWETEGIKSNTGLSYVALKPMGNATVCDWSAELGGEGYAIASTCKNPEKALQLLDYLCSPEGTRIAYSGLEGLTWEMVDGKAQLTQQYIEDSKNLGNAELVEKYGQPLGHMVGYVLNVVNPADNSTVELKYTPEYKASQMTEDEKDALAFYGVDSIREIYTKDTKSVMTVLGEYNNNIPSWPDELAKDMTDLQNFVYRNYLNCIFAKDEADFEEQKQDIIEGAADYNIDGLYQWFKEQFDIAKEAVDPYLQ